MRHSKKFNHLGRTAPHRKAMLSNMASSLILHKRITTTVAKAKALRKYVEPLITKSKSDTTNSRRVVFSYLQDKVSTALLFDEIAERIAERPGGYTRILKLGNRLGDNAEMAFIELVDFNETYQQEGKKKTRTRRSRRAGKKNKSVAYTEEGATEETNEASSTQTEETPEVKSETNTEPNVDADTSESDATENPSENQGTDAEEKDNK